MYSGEKLKELVENSNYHIMQVNGQRIYSMRFSNAHDAPPKGCELFVGKLPRDMFEDELVPLFSAVAAIYEIRLMVDFVGRNRGYCFVRYFTREDAEEAIQRFNNYEVRAGCNIGVYKSLDNTRLFVGGIPEDKTKNEIKEALEDHIDAIKDIIMYPAYNDENHNRGYAFLEFDDHRAAAIARRRLPPGSLMLWGAPIKIDWADPLPEPDPVIMSKVTTLYIRNIPTSIKNEEFRRQIYDVIDPDVITKIHKTLDYAFLHFVNRKSAEEGKHLLRGLVVNENSLEVSWARPEVYSKKFVKNSVPQHYCLSLPARSRWLIKRKNHGDRAIMSDVSSDYDDVDSQRSNNSPLIVFRPKIVTFSRGIDEEPSTSHVFRDMDFYNM